MKPAAFQYLAPRSVAEAFDLMASNPGACALAGGQSLVPMMNFRLRTHDTLIDLNGLRDWSYIEPREGKLVIGAMTRQSAIEDSKIVARDCPLMLKAIRFVAHRAIRNRGTIGGSLATAYPGAELPLVVVTMGGEIILESIKGKRRVPAKDFFLGALETALQPGELIVAIELPTARPSEVCDFVEVARRHSDFALAAAAVIVSLDKSSNIAALRLGVSGATPIPVRLSTVEAAAKGRPLSTTLIGELVQASAAAIDPSVDPHNPKDYLRSLVAAVVERSLDSVAAQVRTDHAG